MKKILSMVLMLTMVLMLAACGKSEEDSTSAASDKEDASVSVEETEDNAAEEETEKNAAEEETENNAPEETTAQNDEGTAAGELAESSLRDAANTDRQSVYNQNMAFDEAHIYFVSNHELYRCNYDGSEVRKLDMNLENVFAAEGKLWGFFAEYQKPGVVYCLDPETPMTWRQYASQAGTGAIGDVTAHVIALSDMLVGSEIEEVMATSEIVFPERPAEDGSGKAVVDTDDQVYVMVRYANVDVTAGESYDPRSAVMYVRDDEDGDLVQAETLSEGTYTVETDLDLTKPAVYTVTVTAMDKSKNRSDERFTVSVKQKKDEPEKTAEASLTPSATPTPSASATPAPTATPVPSTQPVMDTKAPVVMVRYANVNIAAGSSYTVGQGIVYIRDETDGDLPYADQLQNGYYTVTTDLDVNTPGTYTVLIRARDRSGNESSEQFTVKVIAPRESSAPTEGGSSGGYVPAANTAAGQIYGYLTGTLGLNRASAFGILAHMQRESGYNPQAYNPSGYYGLCQWGGGRYENLKTWCEGQGLDYKTIDGQLQFMRMELEGSYAGVLADLRSMADSADGAYDAAYAFGMRYEVSGEYLADSAGQTARNMFNQ